MSELTTKIGTIPCKCGSIDFREVITDQIDYTVIEKDCVCNKCKHVINSWVAGFWLHPITYEELYKLPQKEIEEFWRYR